MSKLKVFMTKHNIKRDELVDGTNKVAGFNIVYAGKISLHHKGLELEDNIKDSILTWLKKEKGLTPSKTTIF